MVSSSGGETIFSYPPVRGKLAECARFIYEQGCVQSTSQQIASLFGDVCRNPTGKLEKEVLGILDQGLWEFTGNLYLSQDTEDPVHGILLWDGLEFNDYGCIKADKLGIIRRLNEDDPSVRLVQVNSLDAFGGDDLGLEFDTPKFIVGEKIPIHPYLIGRYGGGGVKKIRRLANQFTEKVAFVRRNIAALADYEKITSSAIFKWAGLEFPVARDYSLLCISLDLPPSGDNSFYAFGTINPEK